MHSNEAEQHLSTPASRIHLHASQCHSLNSLIQTLRLFLYFHLFPLLFIPLLSFPFISFPRSFVFFLTSVIFLFVSTSCHLYGLFISSVCLILPFSLSLLFLYPLTPPLSSPPPLTFFPSPPFPFLSFFLIFTFIFCPHIPSSPWLPDFLPPLLLLLSLSCPVMSISRASGDHSRQ